jgi:hypothetical protein
MDFFSLFATHRSRFRSSQRRKVTTEIKVVIASLDLFALLRIPIRQIERLEKRSIGLVSQTPLPAGYKPLISGFSFA